MEIYKNVCELLQNTKHSTTENREKCTKLAKDRFLPGHEFNTIVKLSILSFVGDGKWFQLPLLLAQPLRFSKLFENQ